MKSDIAEDLAEVTVSVWSTTLGKEAERVTPGPSSTGVMRRIEVMGDWHGSVVLECDPEIARLAAAVMFELDPTDTTEKDALDALGELLNVIAGNARGLLGSDMRLGLPDGERPVGRRVTEVAFECEGHPFRVSIVEDTPSPRKTGW